MQLLLAWPEKEHLLVCWPPDTACCHTWQSQWSPTRSAAKTAECSLGSWNHLDVDVASLQNTYHFVALCMPLHDEPRHQETVLRTCAGTTSSHDFFWFKFKVSQQGLWKQGLKSEDRVMLLQYRSVERGCVRSAHTLPCMLFRSLLTCFCNKFTQSFCHMSFGNVASHLLAKSLLAGLNGVTFNQWPDFIHKLPEHVFLHRSVEDLADVSMLESFFVSTLQL